jgi:multiple sugar transport system substrate-binding protein
MKRALLTLTALITAGSTLTGCGGGSAPSGSEAAKARGPITIWYSNNAEEVAWGKEMVASWNAAHPDQKVTGQEIPAGKSSEEVIGAAITAGNAPCLVYNTAPAAIPQFQKQGGLVALDDFEGGRQYVEGRTGARAGQYRSPDGKYYQLPWKANPVVIFYNKKIFEKAGIDAENPPLKTYDQFLATARTVVEKGGVPAAIWPAPSSEFFQSWFDFYPLLIAETGGRRLVENGKAQFAGPEGQRVAQLWRTLYAEKLAPAEKHKGDAFAEEEAAMAIVGPWAVKVYGEDVDWGAAPVPTSTERPADQIKTFSDQKSAAMYSACKNRGTAWEFLKFTTAKDADGKLLETTGQMPMRANVLTTYADYFAKNPAYKTFAEHAERTVEVPNVPNSVTIWQTFRDAYSKSVIFGKEDPNQALSRAAGEVEKLAGQP